MKSILFLIVFFVTLFCSCSNNVGPKAKGNHKIYYTKNGISIQLEGLESAIIGNWYFDSIFENNLFIRNQKSYTENGFSFSKRKEFSEIKKIKKTSYFNNYIGNYEIQSDSIIIIDKKNREFIFLIYELNDTLLVLNQKLNKKKNIIYICKKDLAFQEKSEVIEGPRIQK